MPVSAAELNRDWAAAVEAEFHARRRRLPGIKPALRRTRGRVAIVTDSACCLPSDRSGGLSVLPVVGAHIRVVPIPVMIDHPRHAAQMYAEASDELERDVALAVAQGTPVRTSRPTPGRLAQTYRSLQDQGFGSIVSIHISGKLSGTADAARLAAGQVDIDVTVIDSQQAGMALGETVLEAAMTARLGGSAQETAQRAQDWAAGCESLFAVPSLEQLRRGGRVNRVASIVGTMMGVKPVLGLQGGEVVLVERPRNMARAVDRLADLAAQVRPSETPSRLSVLCFGNPEQGVQLAQRIQPHSQRPVPVLGLPPGLAAHLGLGAIAVASAPGE